MTTRTLVILRHAKAANPAGVDDAERPLTDRGHADAAAAGAWLATRFPPDRVLCSPARRTRQTWHGVALALSSAPQVSYEPAVYAAEVDDLVTLLQSVEATTLLLVGHNPGVSQLSQLLDPDGADPDGADPDGADGLSTAGIVVHRLTGDWSTLGPGTAPVVEAHTARA